MKIDDYRLLLQLSEYGTIRATAKKILISQPAITQRLKYMEDYFGGEIFLRTPKHLLPTAFGEVILSHARMVLQRENLLHDQLSQSRGTVSGTLSIGASSLFSQRFLPEVLESFTKLYPDVTIDLVTGVSEEIRQSASEFHVSVVRGEPLKDRTCIHLFSDPLFLFDTEPFQETTPRPFIEFKSDPSFQKLIESWMMDQKQLSFKRSIKVDQFETAKQMMKRGLGMTVLPKSLSDEKINTYHHMPLQVKNRFTSRETWLCVKEELRQLTQVEAFIRHIEGKAWV